jgi:hypothetical protein
MRRAIGLLLVYLSGTQALAAGAADSGGTAITTIPARRLVPGLALPLWLLTAEGGAWVLLLTPHDGRGWTVHAATDTAAQCEDEKRKFLRWFAGLLDEQQAPADVWEREFTWATGAQCVPARAVTGYLNLVRAGSHRWSPPAGRVAAA